MPDIARPKSASDAFVSSTSTTLPSATMAMRSQMERSSINSEETITTVMPFSRLSRTSVSSTSFLAPMSMPRVGSETNSSFGFIASARAMQTFCWLPPESVPACCCAEKQRISSSLMISSA